MFAGLAPFRTYLARLAVSCVLTGPAPLGLAPTRGVSVAAADRVTEMRLVGAHATRHVFDTVGLAGERWQLSVVLAFTLRIALANAGNDARNACIELSRR